MKYFIKTFLLIIIINIVVENTYSSIAPFLIGAIGIYYVATYPIFIVVFLIILHFLNLFLKDRLDFILRLFCLYFFTILLYNVINDFFPYRFEGYKNMIDLSVEEYYKTLIILYACGAINSGYFFAKYKFVRRDVIFILLFFISTVIMKFFKLQDIFSHFLS